MTSLQIFSLAVFCWSSSALAANILIRHDQPEDVEKYLCSSAGETSSASNINVLISCPDLDSIIIDEHEVAGCKLEAKSSLKALIAFSPASDVLNIKPKAFTALGKSSFNFPGLTKQAGCNGTLEEPCIKAGSNHRMTLDINLPGLIPFPINGKPATLVVKDENEKNLVCFNIPIFLKANVPRRKPAA